MLGNVYPSKSYSRSSPSGVLRNRNIMGSTSTPDGQLVHSNGIYHGLPDLSYAPKGMTAIVTGANGISGAHMVRRFPHVSPSLTFDAW